MLHDPFRGAPDQQVPDAGESMRRDDDKVNCLVFLRQHLWLPLRVGVE
jgi:hypothetical protein